jgi:hypothetical protein
LLVCATANTVDVSLPPIGVRAVPFVFSAESVGSPELGWWTTADFRRCLGRRLAADGTLQAATAISGAAVASALGHQGRIPSTGTALALLNARLGVWLPNPRSDSSWPSSGPAAGWLRIRRPTWLLREILGFMPSGRRFIYVSDGGHLDNLGLLELLRRRCRLIVLVDASGDKVRTTGALNGALSLAAAHLDVTATREDLSPLAKSEGRWPDLEHVDVVADCVEKFTVTYPDQAEPGTVVLVKAAFAKSLIDDPDAAHAADLVNRGRWPRLWWWSTRNVPKVSTVNQWLTDDQYDALVSLGRAAGRRASAVIQPVPAPGGPA